MSQPKQATLVNRLRDEVINRADIPLSEQTRLWYFIAIFGDILDLDDILPSPPSERIHRLRTAVQNFSIAQLEPGRQYFMLEAYLEELLPELLVLARDNPEDLDRRDQIADIEERIHVSRVLDHEKQMGREGRRLMAIARLLKPAPGNEDECSLCYNTLLADEIEKFAILPCGHVYGAICITTWLEKEDTCPVCRRDFGEQLARVDLQASRRISMY